MRRRMTNVGTEIRQRLVTEATLVAMDVDQGKDGCPKTLLNDGSP